ncbi:MAG: Gldg family protein [Myxococcaceae bacterium]
MSPSSKSYWLSVTFIGGLLLLYVGERLISTGNGRLFASGLGLLLILVATALRATRVAAASSDANRKDVERAFLVLYVVGLVGAVLYGLQSDLLNRWLEKPLEQSSPKLAVVLAAVWPICAFASLIPTVFAELAYAGMVRAPKVEASRVKDALYSGLGLTFAAVLGITAVYVATVRDVKKDFSYFRTTRAGTSTIKVVQGLTEPVQVALFFPPANEVREQVMEYLSDLQSASPKLEIQQYDQAVDPAKARELSVVNNGALVISRGAKREQLNLGTDLERARNSLRTFDQDFQKRLLQVTRARRVVYVTTGHGERNEEKGGPDSRSGSSGVKTLLSALNLDMKNLSAAEGLATEVPSDAGAVLVLGPTKPFLPEEAAALVRYVRRGGRLLAAIDPQVGKDFEALFAPLGVRMVSSVLADDRAYLNRTSQVSDRSASVVASFTSHPSVNTLSQYSGRVPVFLQESGAFELIQPKPEGLSTEATVRTLPSTFNDLNGNFNFDPPAETRKSWDFAIAVTAKQAAGKTQAEEGRALLFADSDVLADLFISGNRANEALILDSLKWLSGDEAISGTVNSEADTPVQHTKKDQVVWFYATVFLAPALVLACGFWVTRRRRPRARKGQSVAAPIGHSAEGGAQ